MCLVVCKEQCSQRAMQQQSSKAAEEPRETHTSSKAPKKDKTAGEHRFKAYYAQQTIMPAAELPELLATLRRPLPITFRIFDATRDGTSRRLEAEAQDLGATRVGGAWTFAGEARRELRARGDKARDAALRDFLVRGDRFRCLRRQEEVSMASVAALDPRPSDVVLDCCAAPGSKTAQLVERCGTGCVVANEYDPRRARALVARSLHVVGGNHAARLIVCKGDATQLPLIGNTFDRVLCDVPCSGDGALRKTGQRAWRRWRCADALDLHDLQVKIAVRGADLLKVGGRLVYSTCSLNPVENEAVVTRLLKARPDLVLVDHGLSPEWRARPGLSTWKVLMDDCHGDGVTAASEKYAHLGPPAGDIRLDRCARLYPHDGDRGGFFVAAFVKKNVLRTPRLLLRPFEEADAFLLPALCGDLDVSKTCMKVPHPYGEKEARAFIESDKTNSLTLAVMCEEQLIGCVSLDDLDTAPRVGYWFGRAFWNRGYATEATARIVQHSFETLQLERISGTHFRENPASGAVLRKAGFVEVDGPSLAQPCAARGGRAFPTAALVLTRSRWATPTSAPKPRGRAPRNVSGEPAAWDAATGAWLDLPVALDAHPLRRMDADAWARLSSELDLRKDLNVFARSAGGARGAGAWFLDGAAAAVLERLIEADVFIESAGVKIIEKRGGGAAARKCELTDGGRLTFDGADALLQRGALGPKCVVDVDAAAWRALLKGGRVLLSDLPVLTAMSPGTAVARHGGSSVTLWRGAADAVTVMVREGDLERLRCSLEDTDLRRELYALIAAGAKKPDPADYPFTPMDAAAHRAAREVQKRLWPRNGRSLVVPPAEDEFRSAPAEDEPCGCVLC